MHLGGDVRQFPVMEEEEGEAHEEEENVEVMENYEQATTPKVREQGEEQRKTINNDKEDEDSRRARVSREWEAIDQVLRGLLL